MLLLSLFSLNLLLYEHIFQIQTVVIPCYASGRGSNPHCSCAVTVRAGSDVFTINHCNGQHVTGFLSAEDNVLRVYSRNVMFYQVVIVLTSM